ncbi:MAG TPA: hypothetical protein VFS18_03125, partial [Actinomycetota bacterium]|nr:hypothetical protein [Actinomycetota bacterium]
LPDPQPQPITGILRRVRWKTLGGVLAIAVTASGATYAVSLVPTSDAPRAQTLPAAGPVVEVPPVAAAESPGKDEERPRRAERDRRDRKKKARKRRRHVTFAVGRRHSSAARTQLAASAPSSSSSGSSGTASAAEKRGTRPQEGDKKKQPDPEPTIPKPGVALYRLRRSYSNFYFTIHPEKRDEKIDEGYVVEAIEGKVFARPNRYAVPLNTDNGLAGYIFAAEQDGTLPLYYLRKAQGNGDLFTSDVAVKERWENEGWVSHGIVGYVGT